MARSVSVKEKPPLEDYAGLETAWCPGCGNFGILNALKKSLEWGDKIPIGIIYRCQRPTCEEQLPALSKGPLGRQGIDPKRVEKLLEVLV